MSDIEAQDCELEYWNQQAEDYALVQIPCEDLRAIITRAWKAPAFNSTLTAVEAERNRAQLACQQIGERLTASEARAEAAEERVKSLKASLHDTARELWYCAQQAGADWKDEAWVKKSKPGKAYTVANELLESASTLKGASKTKCQSCGGTGEVYSEEIGTGIQCSYCLGEGTTDGR